MNTHARMSRDDAAREVAPASARHFRDHGVDSGGGIADNRADLAAHAALQKAADAGLRTGPTARLRTAADRQPETRTLSAISRYVERQVEGLGRRASPAPASGSAPPIQRVVSVEQFVKDTTSSFLGLTWRKGDETERNEIENLLRVFASAEGAFTRVKALKELTGRARQLNAGPRSGKFKNACARIVNEGMELLGTLEESEEYIEAKGRDERRLQQEEAQREQERLGGLSRMSLEERKDAFGKRYGGALLDTLLDGTAKLDTDARVLRLTQNFARIGFQYTMKNSQYTALLGGAVKGDCSTLSMAMAAICREIFLIDATVESFPDLLVTSAEKTIDAGKEPNAEAGSFWIFENHYWVKANNKEYDPLFGRAFGNVGWHKLVGRKAFDDLGITMEDYGGEYRMVLLYGVGNKRIGRVTPEEWETHKKGVRIKVEATFETMKERVLA